MATTNDDQLNCDALLTRLNLIKSQLEEVSTQCRAFTHDNYCPVKINIFKRKLQTYTQEIKDFCRNYHSEEVTSHLTIFQLECEDLLSELEILQRAPEINHKGPEHRASKLPTIELTKFDGDILKWQEFYDVFCSNIDNRDLSDVDKMLYLKSVLEGKAKEVIDGIQATNVNYQVALKALRDRYGNKSLLIDSHYNALYSVKVCSQDIFECRKTYNEIERHLRILSALGEDTSGNHLRTVIMGRFPENIKYELNLRLKEEERTVENIRTHLELLIRANEMSHRSGGTDHFTTEALVATSSKDKFQAQNASYHPSRQRIIGKKRKLGNFSGSSNKRMALMACAFCKEKHYNEDCPLSLKERKDKLKTKCYICFKEGHRAKFCRSKRRCFHCKREDHNRALCRLKFQKTESMKALVSHSTSLQTAVILVQGQEGDISIKCRTLFDSGSQRSYITLKRAKQLKLKHLEENCLLVYTFGSTKPKEILSPLVTLKLFTNNGITKSIQANVISLITERVDNNQALINIIKERIKSNIILADDYSSGSHIDLFIGSDYYFQFVHNEKIRVKDELFLIKSDFGWLTAGKYSPADSDLRSMNMMTYSEEATHVTSNNFVSPDPPLKENLISLIWDLESLGITDSPKLRRDEEAIENFNRTIQVEANRYYVTWPWIQFPPDLPTNYGLAYGRLVSLIRRLNRESILEYESILREQKESGIIEEILAPSQPVEQTCPPIHYIPHHIVHQAGKKGRIVYDASAKLKGQNSLNECLYKGPLMLEDLTALLINFRTYKIAVTADIEKAFLQIGLQEKDRDVTRFLWLKDVESDITPDNLIHLRFSRVPFGIVSSPFLLTATLRYHMTKRDPELLKLIADRCYADNLVSGADSRDEAYELFKKTQEVFNDLSMNLRDWMSNDEGLLQKIPSNLKSREEQKCKVLGLIWNVKEDSLQLKFNEPTKDVRTKRDVLRILGSVYDPCGIVSPIVLPVKLYLQDLWKQKIKWDSVLSENNIQLWNMASKGLKEISAVKIPRCMCLSKGTYELHCFTDAAEKAYVAVVYLRDKQEMNIEFLIAKSRIAPIKAKEDLKIPKLELLGVLIGTRLLRYIYKALQLPISRLILWTDSQIVLSWLNSNKLLAPFVARRIAEIKGNKDMEFRYVPSGSNPADVGTRPLSTPLIKTDWLTGPHFLKTDESQWPVQTSSTSVLGEDLYVTGVVNINTTAEQDSQEESQIYEPHCDEEFAKIRDLQRTYFPKEYKGKITDISRALHLFKDDKGLLRCKGRFQEADWSQDQKFPILLPRDSEITLSIIDDIHKTNYHVGVSHTLALLRKKYWVTKGRSTVQKVIRRCVQCHKYSGGPFKLPPMPPLPKERVTCCPAFSYTGVDYMGPLKSASGDKRWICVLTCLSIRAIQMEVVHDLTAKEFNLALRRFFATRGLPLLITSDNATQMKLMAEVITSDQCIKNNVKWRFIPELAPWFGGFYERLMGLIKHCMKRTLEKRLLNDQQLLTAVKEIEAVLNTRPLTYVTDDVEHVLSPIDFLRIGGPVVTESSEKQCLEPCSNTKELLIKGWKHGQKLLTEFTNMFTGQYLPYLRQRNSMHREPRVVCSREPKVGEVVQIKADGNRASWKTGKIVELVKSSDGNIRVAKVQTDNGHILTRSISHLYPLELDNESPSLLDKGIPDNSESSVSIESIEPAEPSRKVIELRPKRRAAIKARELLRQMTKQLLIRQDYVAGGCVAKAKL